MIVLDTHTLLWRALEPDRLSAMAREAIVGADARAISAISFQEVAYLVAVALRAGSLHPRDFHGDPIDRLIYATAVEHDARLVTADERLRQFDPERTVW